MSELVHTFTRRLILQKLDYCNASTVTTSSEQWRSIVLQVPTCDAWRMMTIVTFKIQHMAKPARFPHAPATQSRVYMQSLPQ